MRQIHGPLLRCQVAAPGPYELERTAHSAYTSIVVHVTVHFHPALKQSAVSKEHEV